MKSGDIVRLPDGIGAYVEAVGEGEGACATVKAHGFLPVCVPLGDLEVLPPTPLQTYEHVMNEIDHALAEQRRVMGP